LLPIVCLSNHFRNLLLDTLFSYLLLYHLFAMNTSSERRVRAWKRRCVTAQEGVNSATDEARPEQQHRQNLTGQHAT